MSNRKKVLIIGSGFGGIYVLKNLHKRCCGADNFNFAMVNEKNYFLFTPLLHEVATGGLNPINVIEPVRKVLGCCLDNFYLDKAESVDLANKTVKLESGLAAYDYLVLASGSETNFYDTPGAATFSYTLKNLEDAIRLKNRCISQIEQAARESDRTKRKEMLRFVVIGGGPTGVELAAELMELLRENFSHYYSPQVIEDVSVILIQRGNTLVPQFGARTQKHSLAVLKKKGIQVRLDSPVKEITAKSVELRSGEKIGANTIIWTAGVKPTSPNLSESVERTPAGQIVVNEFFQIPGHPEVFVVGDLAAYQDPKTGSYLPALAQVAQKEARVVAKNIRAMEAGQKLASFHYRSSGYLMSLGQWMAVGEIMGIYFSGKFTWWLWRTVYLIKFISWRKKIRIAVDWTMNIFSPRDISEL